MQNIFKAILSYWKYYYIIIIIIVFNITPIRYTIYNLFTSYQFTLSNIIENIFDAKKIIISDCLNDISQITLENIQLKKLLGVTNKYYHNAVIARIVSYNEANIILDAGIKDGIKSGFLVVNQHGVLGKINVVTDNYSSLTLLGEKNIKLSCIIMPQYDTCIIGQKHNNVLQVEYSTHKKYTPESWVVTFNNPKGIIIGNIILQNNKIFVKPISTIDDSDFVIILTFNKTLTQ